MLRSIWIPPSKQLQGISWLTLPRLLKPTSTSASYLKWVLLSWNTQQQRNSLKIKVILNQIVVWSTWKGKCSSSFPMAAFFTNLITVSSALFLSRISAPSLCTLSMYVFMIILEIPSTFSLLLFPAEVKDVTSKSLSIHWKEGIFSHGLHCISSTVCFWCLLYLLWDQFLKICLKTAHLEKVTEERNGEKQNLNVFLTP